MAMMQSRLPHPHNQEQSPQQDSHILRLPKSALECGIRMIDTSWHCYRTTDNSIIITQQNAHQPTNAHKKPLAMIPPGPWRMTHAMPILQTREGCPNVHRELLSHQEPHRPKPPCCRTTPSNEWVARLTPLGATRPLMLLLWQPPTTRWHVDTSFITLLLNFYADDSIVF